MMQTPPKRPVFLFAFSNDSAYRLRLKEEERAIRNVLGEADRRKEIEYKSIGQANLDDIYNAFNRYNNQIYIFHYGGHSDHDFLYLEERRARSESLSTLIGQQQYLKLVFLNGCSNQRQVQKLFDQGVPAVIATRSEVNDQSSLRLSEQFYKALTSGKTIRQAFETAASYIKSTNPQSDIRYRGIKRPSLDDDLFPWGLYVQEESVLEWTLEDLETESRLELLRQLREASRKRYQDFIGENGRFRYLKMDETILTDVLDAQRKSGDLIEDNVKLNGQKRSLQDSLPQLWQETCLHALIIGPGGMGKTVSLLRLWEQWSETEDATAPVPIFIQLNEFNNRPEKDFIRNYIWKHLAKVDLDELLKNNNPNTKGQKRPLLILLLDGFNEVTAQSNELLLEINQLRRREDYPGLQLVMTSRMDMRATYQWQAFHLLELQALSDEQIKGYLQRSLPKDLRLLDLLRNPMMLSIYAAQSELPRRYFEKGLLKEEATSTGEMLYNVEAIQRIKIEEQYSTSPAEQAFRRFILEHLLPYIGWEMQQAGLFFLQKSSANKKLPGLLDILQQALVYFQTEDFFETFEFFNDYLDEEYFDIKLRKLFSQVIHEIAGQDLVVLIRDGKNYRFLHQNFRDYFAARHIQNKIEMAFQQGKLPDILCSVPLDAYIRKLLGELEEEHTNKMAWNEDKHTWQWSKGNFFLDNRLSQLLEHCRGIFDEEQIGYLTWNLLSLWKDFRGELSGANLSRLLFRNFNFNRLRLSRKGIAADLSGSLLKPQNLFAYGDADGVFTADGRRIITRSGDGFYELDVYTGERIRTMPWGADQPLHRQWSNDRRYFISTSSVSHPSAELELWDYARKQLQIVVKHETLIKWVLFNPSGDRIISCDKLHIAKLWDINTGQCLYTFREAVNNMWRSVDFSPDGKRIATASPDYSIKIWLAETGKCLTVLKGHSNTIKELVFTKDGQRITSYSHLDGVAKTWDCNTGVCIANMQLPGWMSHVELSRHKDRLITTATDNKVAEVWDARSGQPIARLIGHSKFITSVMFDHTGNRVLTGSADGSVKLWDVESGQCLLTLIGHQNMGAYGRAFNKKGDRIITGSRDNFQNEIQKVWDTETGKCLFTLYYEGKKDQTQAFGPEGRYLISTGDDQTFKYWDTEQDRCLVVMETHSQKENKIKISGNGKHIFCGDYVFTVGGVAKGWQCERWDAPMVYNKAFMEFATIGACSFDGSTITLYAQIPGGFSILILNTKTGKTLKTLVGFPRNTYTILNRDGRLLVFGLDSRGFILDWESEQIITLFHKSKEEGDFLALALSDNERFVASTTSEGGLTFWDITIRELWEILPAEKTNSFKVAEFNKDGSYLAAGDQEGKLLICNIRTKFEPSMLEGHLGQIIDLKFDATGRYLFSTAKDDTVKKWDISTGQCLSKIDISDESGLFIQGCSFRNLHPESGLSEEQQTVLCRFGAIFNDQDEECWNRLMKKHFGKN